MDTEDSLHRDGNRRQDGRILNDILDETVEGKRQMGKEGGVVRKENDTE